MNREEHSESARQERPAPLPKWVTLLEASFLCHVYAYEIVELVRSRHVRASTSVRGHQGGQVLIRTSDLVRHGLINDLHATAETSVGGVRRRSLSGLVAASLALVVVFAGLVSAAPKIRGGDTQLGSRMGTAATDAVVATICETSPYALMVSKFPDRSFATPLCGGGLTGSVYIFMVPGQGVDKVVFYSDGKRGKTNVDPPFDLLGTRNGKPVRAWDTTAELPGDHGLVAKVSLSNGATLKVPAVFTILDPAPVPSTSPSPSPSPDPVPAPSPSPTASPSATPTPEESPSLSPSPSSSPAPSPSPAPLPSPSPSPSPAPAPSPAPSDACPGVAVSANLASAMASYPAGTTYCLSAGTFRVTSPITVESGDRLIGAGRDATFIDGSGLPSTAEGIFLAGSNTYFSNFDIFGAPTPTLSSGVYCGGGTQKSACGKAFVVRGSSLTLQSIDCHDNGGDCVAGGGSANVTVDDLDCWGNGNAYSMSSSFRYAACIKRAAAYSLGNNTTVTNSYVHDNTWVGIWCDYCKYGLFDIENNRFIHNGANGVQWEMSGGWTSDDRAIIRNNVFHGNNYLEQASFRGGIGISSANDVTISGNSFGANYVAGANVIYTASRTPPQPDSRGVVIQGNTLNGDVLSGCGLAGVSCTSNS
jgi:hypothetical protein